MLLYKYAGERGVDILRSLRLKVTPPVELNDPFELLPRVVAALLPDTAQRMQQDPGVLRRAYDRFNASGLFQILGMGDVSYEKYVQLTQQKNTAEALILRHPKTAAEFRERHKAFLSRTFGLLCLSARPDSILMWSHYADCHKGIVVGFDGDQPPFQGDRLFQVNYPPERTLFDFAWAPGSTEHYAFENALIRTKSSNWKHEEEWRALFRLCDVESEALTDGNRSRKRLISAVRRLLRLRDDGETERKWHFIRVPPGAIGRVILGCNCTKDTEKAVATAFLKHSLQAHAVLERAVLHETEFRLNFETVTLP